MDKNIWWKLSIEIDQDLEDIVIWKLNDLGIISFAFNYLNNKTCVIELIIWLPSLNWTQSKRTKLEEELIRFFCDNGFQLTRFNWKSVQEENWLHSWKKYWDIELIGKNFLILPCWRQLNSEYEEKNVIKIEPGLAFGTGGHPSTSLCLEMMELTPIVYQKVLDIGCGSGILSIASKKLGAEEIYSIDNDYLAIESTTKNIELNFGNINNFHLYEKGFHSFKNHFSLLKFDLILCNIFAHVIIKFVPYFFERLNPNGKLILSGIITSQKDEIIKILNLYNFNVDNVLSKKDWICIRANRKK